MNLNPHRHLHLFLVAAILVTALGAASPASSARAADFSVSDAAELIAAINAANANIQDDTITLTTDIVLTTVDNGSNGLPVILSEFDTYGLTIEGNGFAISRSTAGGTPDFRIFEVASGAILTLNNLTIANGNVDTGGSIYNNGTLTITNNTIKDNQVSMQGGGIHNSGTLTVSKSTFYNNTSLINGGAIYNSGTATVTNSTFNSNMATSNGGAIYVSSTTDILNSTIAGNSASTLGGGIFSAAAIGTATLRNTIVADNTGGNCSGTINDGGNNLDSANTCGFTVNALVNTDPLLGPLADNYGTTQTMALLTTPTFSPAIDAGDDSVCPATDQRGVFRPASLHCDIGAYELGMAPETIINSRPPNPDTDTTPTFTFSTAGGRGGGTFMCHIDSGSYAPCTSPYTSSPLADGPHTFEVYAINELGIPDGTPASYTWTVDTTAPLLNLPSDIVTQATSPAGAVVNFVVTATDNEDPNPVVSCDPPSGSTFPIGVTTVACTATDNAGNVSNGSFNVSVVSSVELNPASLDFGNVPVGVTSVAQTVTVTNGGGTDLHIGVINNSGEFDVVNDNCSNATVTPGNNCTFDVYFQPISVGPKAGSVSIPSDAFSSPDSVSLSGIGGTAQTLRVRSNGNNDGMVRESSETSGRGNYTDSKNQLIAVGDDSQKRQYIGILDFDTSRLPDNAVVTGAILRVKVMILSTDTYTELGNLIADVANPFFGTSPTLQVADFRHSATTNVGRFTRARGMGSWITLRMKTSSLSVMNLLGHTQFRIRFTLDDSNDVIKHQIGFLSGNYRIVADRPLLIINYYTP